MLFLPYRQLSVVSKKYNIIINNIIYYGRESRHQSKLKSERREQHHYVPYIDCLHSGTYAALPAWLACAFASVERAKHKISPISQFQPPTQQTNNPIPEYITFMGGANLPSQNTWLLVLSAAPPQCQRYKAVDFSVHLYSIIVLFLLEPICWRVSQYIRCLR